MTQAAVRALLDDLDGRLKDGRILDGDLLAKAKRTLDCDDDRVPVVVRAGRADTAALAALCRRVETTFGVPLPPDFVAFLEIHDGMTAYGVDEAELADRLDFTTLDEDEGGNILMSVSMLGQAIDDVGDLVERGLAPPGILPFHVLYDSQPLIRSALVLAEGALPAAGIVAFNAKDIPSHRSPSLLASHPVVASSFIDWLHNWLTSGFDSTQRVALTETDAALESDTASAAEPIVRGDIVTVDGSGFHWVTEVFEQYDTKKLRYETFANPEKKAQAPKGHPRVADVVYCRRVSEPLRAELLKLIAPELLSFLPSDRPKTGKAPE